MFRSSNFDKLLDNATSHLHLEPDWPSIMMICDLIRQNDIGAKQAIMAIKKKMLSPNPHSAMYALILLESVVKNCGSPVHEEISSKANCEMFTNLIKDTPHENVKNKMLELIQCWAYAFRTSQKYRAIKDTMTILKSEGHTFPELKEADAMFTSDTAPDWADGDVCHRCRVAFSFTQRKHHCRNCGQVFCAQCSSKTSTLPKFGIEKEVRVCEACYMQQQQKPIGKPIAGRPSPVDSELPAEYLASSLAQQTQTPPRKTDQELQEEEELQLAIALSQSEAEHHTKVKTTINSSVRSYTKSPSPEAPMKQSLSPTDDPPSDPELSRYLNRNYWEQRQTTTESPASPSAPSSVQSITMVKTTPEDTEIDDFSSTMKTQLEIFVNRMKSNSSRGRSISNDSSVQTLFMNLTSFHSKLLGYIKVMDDKRMWYEQLQDKLAQVKDSRAALDVLRQEHQEKLRRMAEEMERQRQLQMAHKLEIMRKKKQEYLQYQRQLALQRIQEQEREMQLRQEQQKAHYMMGSQAFPYMPPGAPGAPNPHGSPMHQMQNPGVYQQPPYGYNQMARFPPGTNPMYAAPPGQNPQQQQQMAKPPPPGGMLPPQTQQPGQPQQFMTPPQAPMMMMMNPNNPMQGQPGMDMSKGVAGPMGAPPLCQPQDQQIPPGGGAFPGMQPPPQQGQQPGMPPGMAPPGMPQPGPIMTQQHPSMIPSSAPPPHAQQMPPQAQQMPPQAQQLPPQQPQQQQEPANAHGSPTNQPAPPPAPAKVEVNTAELISFD
ncbi:hepatocyte growth factor-regulated tyrosine kinase substrate [Lutzomyia longipalpis]|uniref:hepatocyte growth factor-regulated tyrosine kinase substrate n=1 Tax=Lutzomyia longipalpis TaxID=7200 RepID=UPI002483A505|nr:hepatocyte growth factor-regulated tyrosine kinase substrate [Lutzomyia longipalpis]